MQLLIEKDTNIVKFWMDEQFQIHFKKDKIICTRDRKIEINDYTLFTKHDYNHYFTSEEVHEDDNESLKDIKNDRLNFFSISHFRNMNTNKLVAVNVNNIEVIKNAPTVPTFIKNVGWNNLKFVNGKYQILFDPDVKKLEKDLDYFKNSVNLNIEHKLNENVYLLKDLEKESLGYLQNNKSSAPIITKEAKEMKVSVKELAEFICNHANDIKISENTKKEKEELELQIKQKTERIEYYNEHQVELEI